jgi:hypothetical protein
MERVTAEEVRAVNRAITRLTELGDRYDDPGVRMTPDQFDAQWKNLDGDYAEAAGVLHAKGIEDDDDLIAALPDLSQPTSLDQVVIDDEAFWDSPGMVPNYGIAD